jgi:potassium-transporting ATPase KdpC subunit
MNRLPSVVRQHLAGLRMLLIFTVITGIIYPVVMWGVSQVAFNHQANGSLVSFHGRVVGSSLLCQEFVDAKGNPLPQYFQPRPSAATPTPTPKGDFGCDPTFSSASNYGPTNPAFIALIKSRQQQISKLDHVPISKIPANAVTASGSGLDPDISPAYAAIQVNTVAAARHISPAQVEALVRRYTTGRTLGFLGEPVVNVLLLNRALDEKYPA